MSILIPTSIISITIYNKSKNIITQKTNLYIDDKRQLITKENNVIKNLINNRNIILTSEANSYKSFLEKIDGVNMLIAVKHIDKLKWNIVSITPVSVLNSEITSFREVMGYVILICTIFSIIAALFLSNDVSRPISQLVKSMSVVKNGNFDINLPYKRRDEFAFLVNQYKDMMRQIKELIDKLYVTELNKNRAELKMKDAELKTLLAQINPHFLYNTLDSINWIAIKYDVKDISMMVKSLSNFFRYSLNNGKNIITLADEKVQVESYLKIQRARFKDRLDYYIEFQPEINECYTVKLILQPLVENAMMHGIEESNNPGLISIIGKIINDEIEIRICDNGIGADVEKLNQMLVDNSISTKSLGIRNVNSRIKHFCGSEYGIKYYRNKDMGITAILRLKIIRNMEELNAEDDNC